MPINAVNLAQSTNTKSTSFGNKKANEDSKPVQYRSVTAKKWGVGIASLLLPGTGQLANGQTKKGFKYLSFGIGIPLVSTVIQILMNKSKIKGSAIVGYAEAIAVIANTVCSIVDAVKNVEKNGVSKNK